MSFRPTQTGLCKFGWVWSSLTLQMQGLVAHTRSDPNRATRFRAHGVAADSRNSRGVTRMSRYTPTKDCVAPVFPPPCRSCVQSVLEREKNRRKIGWGRSRTGSARGVAGKCLPENGSRYTGPLAATLTPIALPCATKMQGGRRY